MIFSPSVEYMCYHVPLIVEGVWTQGNTVRISKIYKSPPDFNPRTTSIEVDHLSESDLHLGMDWGQNDRKLLTTRKVVLFLYPNENKDALWRTVGSMEEPGGYTHIGLYFYDANHCYMYSQVMNPGGLVLGEVPEFIQEARTITELRGDIRTGLSIAKEFDALMAIEDPAVRIPRLCDYQLASAAPQGYKDVFRAQTRQQGLLAPYPEYAVPRLIQLLQQRTSEDIVTNVVLSLYDMKEAAAPALPALCMFMADSYSDNKLELHSSAVNYSMDVMQKVGDASVIPCVQPYLHKGKPWLRAKAAETLAFFKDKDSYEDMKALLPANPTQQDSYTMVTVLKAMVQLDKAKTLPLLQELTGLPEMKQVKPQLEKMIGQ